MAVFSLHLMFKKKNAVDLSSNEFMSVVSKALCARGLPAGTDTNNAMNALWLERHNLGGLSLTLHELKKFKKLGDIPFPKFVSGRSAASISCSYASGLLSSQIAVDLACIGKNVTLYNCSASLLLIAEAARRSIRDDGFQLKWMSKNTCFKALCYDGNSFIIGKIGNLKANYNVSLRQLPRCPEPLPGNEIYLKGRAGSRVAVDRSTWILFRDISREGLVPTNEKSQSGAGPEVDYDE